MVSITSGTKRAILKKDQNQERPCRSGCVW